MHEKEELKASIVLKIVCFLIPIVGLIIYACNVSKNKKYANSCGISSLLGILTPIIIAIISWQSVVPVSNEKGIFSQEDILNEIREIESKMAMAQLSIMVDNSNTSIDAKIKEWFKDYTIVDSSNLQISSYTIKGTMKLKTNKGNKYIVNFDNSTVTKDK